MNKLQESSTASLPSEAILLQTPKDVRLRATYIFTFVNNLFNVPFDGSLQAVKKDWRLFGIEYLEHVNHALADEQRVVVDYLRNTQRAVAAVAHY